MCGILGRVGLHPSSRESFNDTVGYLHHRGPDEQNVWHQKNDLVSLGHTRLAIVAPQNGEQPLTNETGTIRAVVNGEFYDFETERRELEKKGHRFRTDTDSELLVHLYEQYGVDCLQKLSGEFAFALWDSEKKRMFIARDRFGVKPLVWCRHEDSFFVSSTAEPILALTQNRVCDLGSVLSMFDHQYAAPDRTLFDGIYQVRPGSFLLVDERLGLKHGNYWDMHFSGKKESTVGFGDLFETAIKRRLQGDAPVACYLSGGIDSAAVSATVAEQQGSTDVFGVVFPDDPVFDERRFAEQVIEHCGLNYFPVEIGATTILENTRAAVRATEGVAINGHLASKFLLSREVRNAGHKVVLTGEGADELLFGYPHFRQDLETDSLSKIANTNVASGGLMVTEKRCTALDKSLGFTPSFLAAKFALGNRIQEQITDPMRQKVNAILPDDLLSSFDVDQLKTQEPVEISAYLWTRLTLAPYILKTLGDGTEMAHSIEGRTPFLDRDLAEFCLSIPTDQKIRNGIEKSPLRLAMKDKLPESIVTRRKHPFIAPPICFSPDSRDFIQAFLHGQELRQSPFFSAKKLQTKYRELEGATMSELQKYEPVFMLAQTLTFLIEDFGLELK